MFSAGTAHKSASVFQASVHVYESKPNYILRSNPFVHSYRRPAPPSASASKYPDSLVYSVALVAQTRRRVRQAASSASTIPNHARLNPNPDRHQRRLAFPAHTPKLPLMPCLRRCAVGPSSRACRRECAFNNLARRTLIFLQIYFSKKQVDQKLLMRDGSLSWVERCRRKKDQVRLSVKRVSRTVE